MSIQIECKKIVDVLNNVQITELKHAYRINGVVDVWKFKAMVYDVVANEYHEVFDFDKRNDLVHNLIKVYPKQDPYKKTSTGRMSIKEFRNKNFNTAHSITTQQPEDYHWRNKLTEESDDHLYFLIHGDHVKIGRSKDVESRINGMKTGLGMNFECFVFSNKGCMEKQLHICFSDFRSEGEWFTPHWRIKQFLNKYHDGKNKFERKDLLKEKKVKKGCSL